MIPVPYTVLVASPTLRLRLKSVVTGAAGLQI